jgi:uncharacterized protein
MRRVWVLILLSVVACSAKKGQEQVGGVGKYKSEVALANKDEQCPGGTVRGCWDAAMEAELKGDFAQAVELYTRVCDAGGARACNVLGILVSNGSGVSVDPARTYSLFMRACDGGDMSGCYNAAICHRTGTCAEKNDAEATKLLRRACDGGDKDACANLGG